MPSIVHNLDVVVPAGVPKFIYRQYPGINHHEVPHVVGGPNDYFQVRELDLPTISPEATAAFPRLAETYNKVKMSKIPNHRGCRISLDSNVNIDILIGAIS